MTNSIWRELPAPNRRWILVNALLVPVFLNVVITSGIDLLSIAGHGEIQLWGPPLVRPSSGWTVIGTLFILPLITCLLVTTAVHADLEKGTLERLDSGFRRGRGAGLPATRLRRGVAMGVAANLLLAPPLLLAMTLLDFPDLAHGPYVLIHAAFAVALGLFVTPVIALMAMTDPEPA